MPGRQVDAHRWGPLTQGSVPGSGLAACFLNRRAGEPLAWPTGSNSVVFDSSGDIWAAEFTPRRPLESATDLPAEIDRDVDLQRLAARGTQITVFGPLEIRDFLLNVALKRGHQVVLVAEVDLHTARAFFIRIQQRAVLGEHLQADDTRTSIARVGEDRIESGGDGLQLLWSVGRGEIGARDLPDEAKPVNRASMNHAMPPATSIPTVLKRAINPRPRIRLSRRVACVWGCPDEASV